MRFTFVADRFNRTAIASLLSALEDLVRDPDADLRVVRAEDLEGVDLRGTGDRLEVLCLSTMTVNAGAALDAHRKLRRRWGRAFVSICGGAHASGDPASLLRAGVDFCCVGEGEEVIRSIWRGILDGTDLAAVPGLYGLEKGATEGTVSDRHVDIDSYRALPARIRFPTYIEIGRGCKWECSYCQTPQIHGTNERYRSAENVEGVVGRYAAFGMRDFRFLLPNALGYMSERPKVPNCEALEDLLELSRRASRGGRIFLGSFPSEVRPDYVTEQALKILKRSVSNSGIVIGGQSGSPGILDSVHRGHSVEDIKRACRIGLASGFEVSVDLVLGFPGETPEDRTATLDLVRELGAAGIISNMHFFMPLPGTALESAQPVFLSHVERRRLDTLGQQGILRGRWRRQEQTARMLADRR